MEARSFPYDRGEMGWAAAAAAVRFATRQEEAETAVLRTLGVPEPGVPDITPTRHGTPSAERETAALHILEVPRLDAPDITPTCHGTPNAGAGGHKMLMGDDREATAGLGLGDQDRGWSAEARQTEWGVRGGTAGHGGRKFYGEGAWRLPPGRSHERPESRLRHAAFRRWVRGPAPHPRRCACCVSVSGAPRLA